MPSEAPNPIPTLVFIDISLSLETSVFVDTVGDASSVEEIEADEKDRPADGLAEELGVGVGVTFATLNPTIAIAPTLDEADNVFVAVDQSADAPEEVEAYVRTMPLDTLETQSPFTGPFVARRFE